MTVNRFFLEKFENQFEKYKKNKRDELLEEKVSHQDFVNSLPEQISLITSSFQTLINLIDAIETTDIELKNTVKARARKLFRRVQRLMELHKQEEESENQEGGEEINTDDEESIYELSSAGGGMVSGTTGKSNSKIDSGGRYGNKKINVKRFK